MYRFKKEALRFKADQILLRMQDLSTSYLVERFLGNSPFFHKEKYQISNVKTES
jgi:hypothetical protein